MPPLLCRRSEGGWEVRGALQKLYLFAKGASCFGVLPAALSDKHFFPFFFNSSSVVLVGELAKLCYIALTCSPNQSCLGKFML